MNELEREEFNNLEDFKNWKPTVEIYSLKNVLVYSEFTCLSCGERDSNGHTRIAEVYVDGQSAGLICRACKLTRDELAHRFRARAQGFRENAARREAFAENLPDNPLASPESNQKPKIEINLRHDENLYGFRCLFCSDDVACCCRQTYLKGEKNHA